MTPYQANFKLFKKKSEPWNEDKEDMKIDLVDALCLLLRFEPFPYRHLFFPILSEASFI